MRNWSHIVALIRVNAADVIGVRNSGSPIQRSPSQSSSWIKMGEGKGGRKGRRGNWGRKGEGPPSVWSALTPLATHLVFVVVLVFVGATSSKSLKALSFQIGSGWNFARMFLIKSKYASIVESNFRFDVTLSGWRLRRHFFAAKCCHLMSEHEASAGAYAAATISSWSRVHSYACYVLPWLAV